jgi:hypothetical protein
LRHDEVKSNRLPNKAETSTYDNVRTTAENIALKLAKINPAIKILITEFELTDRNGQLINI